MVLPNTFIYDGVVRQFGRKRNLRVMNEKWRDSGDMTTDKCPAGAGFQVLLEGIGLVVIFKPDVGD